MSIGAAPPVSEPQVLLGVMVDPLLKRRVEELAKANERTTAGEVRLALKRHLELMPARG
jgi:hypothetical protein